MRAITAAAEAPSSLLNGVAERDPQALSELYDRHAATVYQLGLLAGWRRAEAERFVVEVFYAASKTAQRSNGRLSERDWILSIALAAIGRPSKPAFRTRGWKRSSAVLRLANTPITEG